MRFDKVCVFAWIIFPLAILLGCATGKTVFGGTKKMSPQEYANWYSSNKGKLTHVAEARKVRFVLEEVPVEFDLARMILREQMTLEDAKQAYSDESTNKSVGYRLTVELPAVGQDIYSYNLKPEEANRATYLAFQLQQQVFVVLKSGDTVVCQHATIDRGMSNHPRSVITLNFSLVDRSAISTVLFNDRFWSDSQLIFDIRSFQTIQIPQLAL